MGHDQRFKEFLQAFLREFLELFYPDVEKRLDFRTVEFLDKEVFTDVGDGSRREADVVAKLSTRDGSPELVLIHVEVQTERKPDISARMFEYYSLLWLRHKIPVFPIVVYLRGGGKDGLEAEQHGVELFGHEILRFRYGSIRLARLDVEEYRKKSGPVGAALGALMDRSASRDPAELRASLLLRVVRSDLDDARQFLLVDMVGTYFELDAEQMKKYERLVSREEYRDVQEVELTWADKLLLKGEEKGLEKGLQAGVLAGKRESVLRVLDVKFGSISENVRARIEAMESADALDECLERAAKATSLEETGLVA